MGMVSDRASRQVFWSVSALLFAAGAAGLLLIARAAGLG